MTTRKITIIAGEEVFAALDTQRQAAVAQTAAGHFKSEQLCEFQMKRSGEGYCEVQIVKSMYGYSVRYASGLHDFALLRAARGASDPSLEAAIKFCREWCAADPTRRYATTTEIMDHHLRAM